MSLKINLSQECMEDLNSFVNHPPLPYLQERAKAILRIFEGKSGRWVALQGLYKKRKPDTVYSWFHNYIAEGLQGLYNKKGRGRKASYYPMDEQEAEEKLQCVVRRSPEDFGHKQSRWRLSDLLISCSDFIKVKTLPGLWQVMKRLGCSFQAARNYVHSPDPFYDKKLRRIRWAIAKGPKSSLDNRVVLFQDEHTFNNFDTLARAYKPLKEQPLALLSHRPRQRRVIGAVDCATGKVSYIIRARASVSAMVNFYRNVVKDFPDKQVIMIEDNWPMHFHPDVIDCLEPQKFNEYFKTPSSWAHIKPSGKYKNMNLPIQIITLPTYASWLNPIEKLWKQLNQEVTHLHGTGNLQDLVPKVEEFLNQFSEKSEELLQYMGLRNPYGIYAEALRKAGFWSSF